jgi:uncharacterized protein YqeY
MLLDTIREDLKTAMTIEMQYRKHGEPQGIVYEAVIAQKTVSRAIISMFPEIGKKPAQATDDDTIKLLKKYIGQEKERQLYIDKHITESDINGIKPSDLKKLIAKKYQELGDKLTSPNILIAQKYLPKQASEEEIGNYIKDHIDLSQFKNKMQAMGQIMKAFPGCDGNFVKNILLKL